MLQVTQTPAWRSRLLLLRLRLRHLLSCHLRRGGVLLSRVLQTPAARGNHKPRPADHGNHPRGGDTSRHAGRNCRERRLLPRCLLVRPGLFMIIMI